MGDVIPRNIKTKYAAIILFSIFLIISISSAADIDPTIYRSAFDESKFRGIVRSF